MARNGFRRSQERRETLAAVEEFGGATTPTPGEHGQAEERRWVGQAPTQAGAHPAAAHPYRPRSAHRAPRRAPAQHQPPHPPVHRREPSEHTGGGGGDGWQGGRLRTCPVRGSAPGSGPTTGDRRPTPCRSRPARPARVGCPTRRPTP